MYLSLSIIINFPNERNPFRAETAECLAGSGPAKDRINIQSPPRDNELTSI